MGRGYMSVGRGYVFFVENKVLHHRLELLTLLDSMLADLYRQTFTGLAMEVALRIDPRC